MQQRFVSRFFLGCLLAGAWALQIACGSEGQHEVVARGPQALERIDPRRWMELVDAGAPARSLHELPAEALTNALIADVSEVSGLPMRRPVPVQVLSFTDEVVSRLLEEATGEPSPAMKRMGDGLEVVVQALGLQALAPEGVGDDEQDEAGELLEPAQLLGLYNPTTAGFYVRDDLRHAQRSLTIRHELMHALQDQSYPLQALMERPLPDFDRFLALKAVIEGQAEVAAALASRKRMAAPLLLARRPADPFLSSVFMAARPTHWQKSFLHRAMAHPLFGATQDDDNTMSPPDLVSFPYSHGSHFFAWLLQQTGRDSFAHWVQQTLTQPPQSTREIFRPELYLAARAGLRPPQVQWPTPMALDGHTVQWESSLGELVLRGYLWLQHPWRQEPSAYLASQFVGDKAAWVTTEDDASRLYWLTRWQHPAAANNFAQLAQKAQAEQPRASRRANDAPKPFAVGVQGTHVLVAVALPAAQPLAPSAEQTERELSEHVAALLSNL